MTDHGGHDERIGLSGKVAEFPKQRKRLEGRGFSCLILHGRYLRSGEHQMSEREGRAIADATGAGQDRLMQPYEWLDMVMGTTLETQVAIDDGGNSDSVSRHT